MTCYFSPIGALNVSAAGSVSGGGVATLSVARLVLAGEKKPSALGRSLSESTDERYSVGVRSDGCSSSDSPQNQQYLLRCLRHPHHAHIPEYTDSLPLFVSAAGSFGSPFGVATLLAGDVGMLSIGRCLCVS